MTKTIFFIVGEPSGDALGASLMQQLKAQSPEPLNFAGVGGPLMEAEGLKSSHPMEQLCVMGLVEVLAELPRLMRLIKTVAGEVEIARPDALITIDLPDFNFQIVKRLRKANFQTRYIHYIAPSVWAWRKGRAKMVAEIYDLLFCAFPFEPDYFKPHGLDARFIGHPMVERDLYCDVVSRREQLNVRPGQKVLGLFMGSRRSEFQMIGQTLIETAEILQTNRYDVRVVVPTLPQNKSVLEELFKSSSLDYSIITNQDNKWEDFAICDVALAVSGTVALELAYLKVPHILTYKAHPISYFLAKNLVKINNIHLANIIMGETIVPEFIQDECNAEVLSNALGLLLDDEKAIQKQKDSFADLGHQIGAHDALSPSEKAAQIVLEKI